ncbi:MAG TPA: PhnD/SsuA/transferrin family substrate-binding protein [Candidatus Acidoferrales bacterium]|nr:PhnD/SsuA/transferrin family substrate-binding protein [Candidatus Acidoferrales bacterium]
MSRSSGGRALRVGAVAYDPKVITIWEGFLPYFAKHGAEIDYVLYSNYDAQVEANLSGEVDVAWNSPLAWVKSQIASKGACVAIAMRDSDRDLTTKIIVRSNSQLSSLADLKGKTIAVGASDSPQATLIPLNLVAESGLDPFRDCEVAYHNVMVGKHGDHVGGERDAARALASGAADAACVLDANYGVFVNEGTLDPGTTRVLATTPPFDHCNFTVRASLSTDRWKPFVEALLGMSFHDPEVRAFMEMEGLKRWLPARTTGYAQLEKAVERFNFYGGAAISAAN